MTAQNGADGHPGRWRQCWLRRLLCYVAGVAAMAIIATVLTRLVVPPAPCPWHQLVWIKNLLLPVALFVIYGLLVRRLEGRPAAEVDIRRRLGSLLPGTVIGASTMTLFFLLLALLGVAQVRAGTGLRGIVPALLVPLVTAAGEELLFWAILFRVLEEVFGSFVAVLASAALFGLAHIANPGANPFTITALSVELG